MKNHMKKLTAAFLAVAMALSLAVSASATTPATPAAMTGGNVTDWGDSDATQTAGGSVSNQGALPDEVVNVVMPVASTNAFGMIFDAKDMITTTEAAAFKPATGDDYDYFATFEGKRFFFQNVAANAAVAKYEKLGHDIGVKTDGDDYIPAGTKVAVYAVATTNTVLASVKDDGTLEKWLDSDGSTDKTAVVNAAVLGSAALTNEVYALGSTKDAIADIQKAHPEVEFKKVETVTVSGKTYDKYTYVTYDTTALRYYLKDNGKVYSTLGETNTPPTEVTSGTTDLTALTEANYKPLPQLKTNFVTYKPTSNEVEIINKGNKPINVSMKAELSGIAEPAYTYATSYDSANDKFYKDGAETTGATIYLALEDGTPADTSVMAYDATAQKATAKINATLAACSRANAFVMEWNGTAGKYVYTVDETLATADFPSLKLKFTGAINDDDDWSTLPTGAAMSVTWNVKASKVLATPTLSFPAAFSTSKTWTVNIDNNKDSLTIVDVNVYMSADGTGTAIPLTVTNKLDANNNNELVGFTVTTKNMTAAGLTSKPGYIKVTFQDPTDADFTVTAAQVVTQ